MVVRMRDWLNVGFGYRLTDLLIVGRVFDWLSVWLIKWCAIWLIKWLREGLNQTSCSFGWFIDRWSGWLVEWMRVWLFDWLFLLLIGGLFCRLVHFFTTGLYDCPMRDCCVVRLFDWLFDWLFVFDRLFWCLFVWSFVRLVGRLVWLSMFKRLILVDWLDEFIVY